MKTVTDIAKQCNTTWEIVYRGVQRLNIIPAFASSSGRIKYYDDFQLELIIDHLFYAGKITELVFESSMNTPEIQEDFNEFKKKTYGRAIR